VLADYLSKFEARCDKKMKILKDKFNFQRKTEIREIEQRKNSQTNILIRCHKVAIDSVIKNYSNITLNNLVLSTPSRC
jgi:hypothetical protein